jgi:hypothetical protein
MQLAAARVGAKPLASLKQLRPLDLDLQIGQVAKRSGHTYHFRCPTTLLRDTLQEAR